MKTFFLLILTLLAAANTFAQTKSPIKISSTAGVSYDGYWLTANPATPVFYPVRKPWHSVRQTIGGYDTYGMLYEGQYLQLPNGLKNGEYILEIEIDPHHWYKESNKANNTFRMKINIQKQNPQ